MADDRVDHSQLLALMAVAGLPVPPEDVDHLLEVLNGQLHRLDELGELESQDTEPMVQFDARWR